MCQRWLTARLKPGTKKKEARQYNIVEAIVPGTRFTEMISYKTGGTATRGKPLKNK